MPNWCQNSLVISKATNPQIERIIEAATRQELLEEFLPAPDWQSTPNEDGVYPGPIYQRRFYDRTKSRIVRTWTDCPRFPNGKQDDRWYSWSVDHWGTKWDVSEVDVTREGSSVFISFSTAWSPVSDEWLEALAAAMPGAEIANTFRESGCDFYGVSEVIDNSASTIVGEISDIRNKWIKENFSAEQIAIFNDENHDDYWEVYEEIWEAWCDVEADELDKAMVECVASPN